MKIQVMAAVAALTLTALPVTSAFASPASVVPDTLHKIGRGAGQVVNGTYHGVAHQAGNVGHAARSTGRSIGHGVHRITHPRSRRHYSHHYSK
ncbi:MAG: hypothetical protein WA840_04725 [Caulobacteraceae bacterium]